MITTGPHPNAAKLNAMEKAYKKLEAMQDAEDKKDLEPGSWKIWNRIEALKNRIDTGYQQYLYPEQ